VYNAPRFTVTPLRTYAKGQDLRVYPPWSLRLATSRTGSISSQIKTNRWRMTV